MALRSAPVIWDVVEEHLDEAAFLSGQWERALASPRFTIAEAAEGPEERLRAHLDGLAAGGPDAVGKLLVPALADDDVEKVFAAAAALCEHGELSSLRQALPAAPAAGRAVARALALTLPPGRERDLAAWLEDGDEGARAVALEALAFRGAAPATGLTPHLASRLTALATAALAAAAAAGDAYRNGIEAALSSPVPAVRDAALRAAVRLGLRGALAASRRAVEAGADPALPLEILALGGDREDLDRIAAALHGRPLRRAALWAAGLSGAPAAGDLCLESLYEPALARLAFEALSAIAGPAVARLTGPEPPPDEEERAPAPATWAEAELPYPDPELVESAWRRLRPRLGDGQRWLAGEPFGPDALLRAFVAGPTRRRHALALDLTVRSRGELRVETRGWARDQLRAQAARRLVSRADVGEPWSRLLRA